jgi:hypothetical protein
VLCDAILCFRCDDGERHPSRLCDDEDTDDRTMLGERNRRARDPSEQPKRGEALR